MADEATGTETTTEQQSSNDTSQSQVNFAELINSDGSFKEGFRDALPDGLGEHSWVSKYDNITDVLKGGVNQNGLVGQKAEDFWTSEDPDIVSRRNEIRGVPADVSGYEYDAPEYSEGMPVDAINARIEQFKAFAKEKNMPASIVKDVLEFDLNGSVEQFGSMQAAKVTAKEEAETQLREEWKGDKFQYNVDKAKNALEHLGLEEWTTNPTFGNDPKFIKDVFDKIVPLINDDVIIEARQSQNMATISDSLDSVEGKIMEFTGDQQSAAYKNLIKQRTTMLEQLSRT